LRFVERLNRCGFDHRGAFLRIKIRDGKLFAVESAPTSGVFYRRLTFYVFYRFAKEANASNCDFFLKYCRKIDR
jgi:hypothetical protein